jgi:hypothetical protein
MSQNRDRQEGGKGVKCEHGLVDDEGNIVCIARSTREDGVASF